MIHEQVQRGINKTLTKPLALTAGILGLLQGFVWLTCSVLSLFCYYDDIQLENRPSRNISNTYEYYEWMVDLFLKQDTVNDYKLGVILEPNEFIIFIWFYVVFSAIWVVISGAITWAMTRDKWQLTKFLFGSWTTLTLLISIVDIVLAGLLISDYVTVKDGKSTTTEMLVSFGIMMSIAARGYILWIINIIFALIMMKYTINIISKQNKESTMPIIHGYENNDNSVKPTWFNNAERDYWGSRQRNSAGYDNHGFERSQSFYPTQTNENEYTTLPSNSYVPTTFQSNTTAYSNVSTTIPTNTYNNVPSTIPSNTYNNVPKTIPSNTYNPVSTAIPSSIYKDPNKNNTTSNSTPANQPSTFSEAIRTATIGRNKGRRSPLNHVAPPIIPDPDYTPPATPTALKSVLRNKSNYSQPPLY